MTTAETVRAATLAVAGVHRMHPGQHGTAATYSVSGRVSGVRLSEQEIDVHVIAVHGYDLRRLGDEVSAAVRRATADYAGAVRVHVEELHVDEPPVDEQPLDELPVDELPVLRQPTDNDPTGRTS